MLIKLLLYLNLNTYDEREGERKKTNRESERGAFIFDFKFAEAKLFYFFSFLKVFLFFVFSSIFLLSLMVEVGEAEGMGDGLQICRPSPHLH